MPKFDDMRLTPKQRNFVMAYVANGGNGTQAAIEAGYSKNTSRVIGTENLAKPAIATAVLEYRAEQRRKNDITVEGLTKELLEIAEEARASDNPSAAVSAINSVAKLHGLNVEDRKNARSPYDNAMDLIAEVEKRRRGNSGTEH